MINHEIGDCRIWIRVRQANLQQPCNSQAWSCCLSQTKDPLVPVSLSSGSQKHPQLINQIQILSQHIPRIGYSNFKTFHFRHVIPILATFWWCFLPNRTTTASVKLPDPSCIFHVHLLIGSSGTMWPHLLPWSRLRSGQAKHYISMYIYIYIERDISADWRSNIYIYIYIYIMYVCM